MSASPDVTGATRGAQYQQSAEGTGETGRSEEIPASVRERGRAEAAAFFEQEPRRTIHLPSAEEKYDKMFIERGIPKLVEQIKEAFTKRDYRAVVGNLNFIWNTCVEHNLAGKPEVEKEFNQALASALDSVIQAFQGLTATEKELLKASHRAGERAVNFFETICALDHS